MLNSIRVAIAICALAVSSTVWAQSKSFDVPAQPAATGVPAFARQADVQLLISAADAEGRRTNEVKGVYEVPEALNLLMRNTGLIARRTAPSTWTIVNAEGRAQNPTRLAQAQIPSAGASEENWRRLSSAVQMDETIVVTGSHIRQGTGAASPVIVIDRKQIEDSGESTVGRLLAKLPQNVAALSDTPRFGDANAVRASTINLRGLGSDSTLVLVNGRRVVASGASTGEGAYVDISSIPLAAIQRIEVLTDGASALYGSDAVGGVVNIILRRDFEGTEVAARYGVTTEKGYSEHKFSAVHGAHWDRGNLLIAAEYNRNSELNKQERAFINGGDLRSRGGPDLRTTFATPGNVLTADANGIDRLGGAMIAAIPRGQDGTRLTPQSFAAGIGQSNLGYGDLFASFIPAAEQASVFARAEQQITPILRAFGDAYLTDRRGNGRSNTNQRAVTIPVTNPFNIFGERVIVRTDFSDLGPITNTFQVTAYNLAGGIEASLARNWTVDASVFHGRERTETTFANFTNSAFINAAVADTNPATSLNLFGDGVTANNNPNTLRGLLVGGNSHGRAAVIGTTVIGSGDLFAIPSGMIKLAVGSDYRRENYKIDTFDASQAATPTSTSTDRSRNAAAAFGELLVPFVGERQRFGVLQKAELSLAGRYERYNDFGSTAKPKVSLALYPVDSLLVRASYGESFKAPHLSDLFKPANTLTIAAGLLTDPARNERPSFDVHTGGNPDLKPEESKNVTVGLVFKPQFLPSLRTSVDYYDIKFTNRITSNLFFVTVLANEQLFPGLIHRAPPTPDDIARGVPGRILFIDVRTQNSAGIETSGFDVRLNYSRLATPIGDFTFDANLAFVRKFDVRNTPSSVVSHEVNAFERPQRFRGVTVVSWVRGSWDAATTFSYVPSYHDTQNTNLPGVTRDVDSYATLDQRIGYTFRQQGTWLDRAKISFMVFNVFNKQPPASLSLTGYDPTVASPKGRTIYVDLTRTF